MKVRNGFVSNSSSSSFLVVMAASDYQNVLDSLSPLEVAIMEHADLQHSLFGGQDCVMHYHVVGNYASLEGADYEYIVSRAREIAEQRGILLEDLYEDYSDYEDEKDFFNNEIGLTEFITFTHKAKKLADDDKAMIHRDSF